MPFRTAYKICGQIVADCISKGLVLDNYPIDNYKSFSELFESDVYNEISLETCVNKRISEGGTSVKSVEKQLAFVKEKLQNV